MCEFVCLLWLYLQTFYSLFVCYGWISKHFIVCLFVMAVSPNILLFVCLLWLSLQTFYCLFVMAVSPNILLFVCLLWMYLQTFYCTELWFGLFNCVLLISVSPLVRSLLWIRRYVNANRSDITVLVDWA